jgi:hypothetical protein
MCVPHLDDNGLLQPQDWIMANQNPGAVGATAAIWPRFIAARRHRLPADGVFAVLIISSRFLLLDIYIISQAKYRGLMFTPWT